MPTITVRLDAVRAAKLKRLARQAGSELLREALDCYEGNARGSGSERPYDRIKHLVGSVRSGVGDLSVNTGKRFTEMLLEEKRIRDASLTS
ncbi:MAG: hypothetical protein ACYDC3_19020 [Candidatus Binataceae bacterium]